MTIPEVNSMGLCPYTERKTASKDNGTSVKWQFISTTSPLDDFSPKVIALNSAVSFLIRKYICKYIHKCFHISSLLVSLDIVSIYWLISQLAFCELSVSILHAFSSGGFFFHIWMSYFICFLNINLLHILLVVNTSVSLLSPGIFQNTRRGVQIWTSSPFPVNSSLPTNFRKHRKMPVYWTNYLVCQMHKTLLPDDRTVNWFSQTFACVQPHSLSEHRPHPTHIT